MLNHNWIAWPALVWLMTCCLLLGSTGGQGEKAIGAHRVFEKTSFSCAGRPAGYYADIETGCQIYHMCDGLGRQFSYSCPNTTLFQQRMLICDHWYMVNCSRAESDYAANLLIGQRDKPFVNDEENSLRTPRPDLLDRPYAPDYSGESFRNQYKQLPAAQNQIESSEGDKISSKLTTASTGQQHWKIPPPSRVILPPAYEAQAVEEEGLETVKQSTSAGSRFVFTTKAPSKALHSTASSATRSPTTAAATTSTPRKASSVSHSKAALLQRQQEPAPAEHEDLGTSHSTRYNTSGDYNSAEAPVRKSFDTRKSFTGTQKAATKTGSPPTTRAPTAKVAVKVPSKIYEPPFLYPIYNQEDASSSTQTPLVVSSATPFVAPATTPTTTTSTKPPISRPITLAGKPFTTNSAPSTATTTADAPTYSNAAQQQSQRFDSQKLSKDVRTSTSAQSFKPPTPRPPTHSPKITKPPTAAPTTTTTEAVESNAFEYKVPTTSRLNLPTPTIASSTPTNAASLPAKELLPPFEEFVQHDVATTQGPPIYYEWKIPSDGLEPPKLEPPIGVDGREYADSVIDYNTISATGGFVPPTDAGPTAAAASDVATARTPTLRSVKETGQPNGVRRPTAAAKTSTASGTPTAAADIGQLRKEFSVPEFAFPLEDIGRTGYLAVDSYNSFQLKIPEQRSDAEAQLHWFGENPDCPECHPSYVVPGTCQPCLRR